MNISYSITKGTGKLIEYGTVTKEEFDAIFQKYRSNKRKKNYKITWGPEDGTGQ